jgi:hypothetical protein
VRASVPSRLLVSFLSLPLLVLSLFLIQSHCEQLFIITDEP